MYTVPCGFKTCALYLFEVQLPLEAVEKNCMYMYIPRLQITNKASPAPPLVLLSGKGLSYIRDWSPTPGNKPTYMYM